MVVLQVAVVMGVLAACGSSSKSDDASSPSGSTAQEGEPSAAFAGKGRNGELATAGTESTIEERQAASLVVEESLRARAARDFATQCETLGPVLVEQLESRGTKGIAKKTCAVSLEEMAKRASSIYFENVMTEPLAALRVNGILAFAFFHGAGGNNYVVPMEKEGAEWKVSSLQVQETP